MPDLLPGLSNVQARLRRLDPDWYPSGHVLDGEWGMATMSGLDAALAALEKSRGLPPYLTPEQVVAIAHPKAPPGLHAKFGFLRADPLPPLMVRVALDLLGTLETPGTADNPIILGWADEVARSCPTAYNRWAADFYNDDAIPWCGLWMAVVAARAAQGRPERAPPGKYLSALEWLNWGVAVPPGEAAVGDVMVLGRTGGGHVTLNVGTEVGGARFFGLGANQSDAVNVMPFDLDRVRGVRRPAYKMRPPGARRVIVAAGGASSTREA